MKKILPYCLCFIAFLLAGHFVFGQYNGGNGGGHALAELIQFDNPAIPNNPQVLYKGGNGGGHASAELILDTNTAMPNNPQRLYVGGNGGGFAAAAFLLDTVETIIQNPQKLYLGGNGGGYSLGIFLLDTMEVVVQNPQKLYLGGNGGGYALAQNFSVTVTVVPQNPQKLYVGGIGGGHTTDTSRASAVVKDCIKPTAPSPITLDLCAGATLSQTLVASQSAHFVRWYDTAWGGKASLTSPIINSSASGEVRYYATYVNDTSNCESDRAMIRVIIRPKPAALAISAPSYCAGAPAIPLSASPLQGHMLNWYADSMSNAKLQNAPTPNTNTPGNQIYYVSQTNTTTGCEGVRTPVITLVNALPSKPVVANRIYCAGAASTALTASAASGHILKWYADSTIATSFTTAPVPNTSTLGKLVYFVSQTNAANGCEGPRAALEVVVNAKPDVPTTTDLVVCQGTPSPVLTATAISGNQVRWYADSLTSNALSAAPSINTGSGFSKIYYVTQVDGSTGCESNRVGLKVTVNALPTTPSTAAVPAYCQGVQASQLTANPLQGHTLNWYADSMSNTKLQNAPTPNTNTPGTQIYYVSQTNATTGCEGVRTPVITSVNALPLKPEVANRIYCAGTASTALTASATSGHVLKWYADSSVATSYTTAPVPNTSTIGKVVYFVSQTNTATGCEGPRAALEVVVNAKPDVPTTTDLVVCQGTSSPVLTATAISGNQLKWYADSLTANALPAAPSINTGSGFSKIYYVTQVDGSTGCESNRVGLKVTVNALPTSPSTAAVPAYCQGVQASQLTANPLQGHTLNWYADSLNPSPLPSAPTPQTLNQGAQQYFVSQTSTSTGCESKRSVMTVSILQLPTPPSASAVNYCQGATATPLVATASAGNVLKWYATNTQTNALPSAPVPSTVATGTTAYYVSQQSSSTGCESNRTKLDVVISPIPPIPVISRDGAGALVSSVLQGLQWYKEGVLINGATSATYKPTEPAYYSVKTNQSGCVSTSVAYYYLVTALESWLPAGKFIRVFPNPVLTNLEIRHNIDLQEPMECIVLDAAGKTVMKTLISQKESMLNLSGLVNGNYQLLIYRTPAALVFKAYFIKM